MAESAESVNMDQLGQAAYTGQLAVVADALASNKQLAHVADTVGNGVLAYTVILVLHATCALVNPLLPFFSVHCIETDVHLLPSCDV